MVEIRDVQPRDGLGVCSWWLVRRSGHGYPSSTFGCPWQGLTERARGAGACLRHLLDGSGSHAGAIGRNSTARRAMSWAPRQRSAGRCVRKFDRSVSQQIPRWELNSLQGAPDRRSAGPVVLAGWAPLWCSASSGRGRAVWSRMLQPRQCVADGIEPGALWRGRCAAGRRLRPYRGCRR